MHGRVEADTPEAPERAVGTAVSQGSVVERVLALQRTAGNAAVTRLVARQEDVSGSRLNWDPSLLPTQRTAEWRPSRFVFILGAKDDEALDTAKAHYRSALMSDPFTTVLVREDMSDPTLAGIFDHLSRIKYPIAEITLVVHGNEDGVLSLPLNFADTDESTTPDELAEALHKGVLTPLRDGQITDKTRIRLQACFAGSGPRMVNLLDWAEIARLAMEESRPGPDGKTEWIYIANAFVQGVKPGYEDDPVLYTKSVYYSPTEI